MREFFRGWKRKVGCVTLLMACVFAAAWIRSLDSGDFLFLEFEFPIGGRIHIYTSVNQLDILIQRSDGWNFDFGKLDPIVTPSRISEAWFFEVHNIEEVFFGEILEVQRGFEVRVYFYAIVIPLTLLSAWLLLSKPRAKTVSVPPITDTPTNQA